MPQSEERPVPILQVQDLTKSYRAFTAVRHVSFDIQAGEVLGVLGPNGAGKSTIVKVVTGLLEPSHGTVLFRGHPIRNGLQEYRHSLGYVPEQPDLYGFLTGWEYIDLVAALRGLSGRTFRQRALTMFSGFNLSHARDLPISSYSKGMRQRVVLISALLHNPSFLVLDEPFSGLDVTSALVVRRVIELLSQAGKAILFSSPVLEQVDKVCTHLVVLRAGQVVSAGSADEMRARFAGLNLEAGFLQLTDQVDTDAVARTIVEAAVAFAR